MNPSLASITPPLVSAHSRFHLALVVRLRSSGILCTWNACIVLGAWLAYVCRLAARNRPWPGWLGQGPSFALNCMHGFGSHVSSLFATFLRPTLQRNVDVDDGRNVSHARMSRATGKLVVRGDAKEERRRGRARASKHRRICTCRSVFIHLEGCKSRPL